MSTIQIPEGIREQLRLALLDEGDFLSAVRQAAEGTAAGPAGVIHCRPTLAVPRPLDPETAELKELEVVLKRDGEAMEIVAVRGLEVEELEG